MTQVSSQRILALDLRPRSFGYVVFEGPEELLEWGVRSFRNGVNEVRVPVYDKLARILEDYAPSTLVLKELRAPTNSSSARKIEKMLLAVRSEAKAHGVAVRIVSRKAVRKAFEDVGVPTKYAIASALAQSFPELAWKLPPKRKPWESEDYRMSIFDAAAVGVAYFASQLGGRLPAPEAPVQMLTR